METLRRLRVADWTCAVTGYHDKLTCAEVREKVAARRERIKAQERSIREILSLCAHDETRDERDYQDPKPYRRCLGCSRVDSR